MRSSVAILASGGLDSCVLMADMARRDKIYPIYVKSGLIWEKEELKALHAFLRKLNNPHIQPVTLLSLPVQSLYGNHWSLTGRGIPRFHDPDSKTYLPGRNVLLLSLVAVWCSQHKIHRIAIGTLKGNPFSDATPDFFKQLGKTVSAGLDFKIRIEAPFSEKYKKADLIQKYHTLPLEQSLSCMTPQRGKHCEKCNKCGERKKGYKIAGVPDRTKYKK